MKKNISIGVVGLGYWGPNLARNFSRVSNCSLKTVCDMDEARLAHVKAFYHEGVTGVTDYQKLLDDPDLDAVAIATPVRHHHSLAKAALLAGKHAFIEKPLASSAEQCEELIDIAQRNGCVLMVGHTFLYSSPVRKIVDIIRAGDIGDIRYINARRLNLGLFQQDINVAWDLAPHDISIIMHVLDEFPLTVNCQGNGHVNPHIEDVTNMSLFFKNKRFATIQSSWLEPRKVREMTIVGTRRMIVYDDIEPLEKIRIYDVRVDHAPHYDTFAEWIYSYHYGDMYVPRLDQEEPLRGECQHFIDCIATGAEPLTSGHDGLAMVRVLEAASASLKQSGAPIRFGRSGNGGTPIPQERGREAQPVLANI